MKKTIWNALSSVFSDAINRRCDMHLKDNVKRKLSELNIGLSAAHEIKGDIIALSSQVLVRVVL